MCVYSLPISFLVSVAAPTESNNRGILRLARKSETERAAAALIVRACTTGKRDFRSTTFAVNALCEEAAWIVTGEFL